MQTSLTRAALAIALAGALAIACADDDGLPGPAPSFPDAGARFDGAAGAGARDGAAGAGGAAVGNDAASNGG